MKMQPELIAINVPKNVFLSPCCSHNYSATPLCQIDIFI